MKEQTLARSLAFFSLGLGLAELLAPRKVARLIGIDDDHDRLLRALGLREIGSGLGIMQGKPASFLWSRVAGDAIDLGLLAAARRSPGCDRRRVNGAIAAVAGVAALDVLAAVLCSRSPVEPGWRVVEPENYRSGFRAGDAVASRTSCDATMQRHQSGHLREETNEAVSTNRR